MPCGHWMCFRCPAHQAKERIPLTPSHDALSQIPGVTAYGALKTTQLVLGGFTLGMCFFPDKLMEGYKTDSFVGTADTAFKFFAGIFGTQQLLMYMLTSLATRDGSSKAVKSVMCLCSAVIFLFFALNDGSKALRGIVPTAMPTESIYGNSIMFIILGLICIAGWQESGSVMPNRDAMMPKGRAKKALTAGLVNLSFFAIGCTFFTEPFVDMYLPGVMETLPGAVGTRRVPVGPLDGPVPMIMFLVSNIGKIIFFAIGTTLAIASVGDEDTTYRLLRVYVLNGVFYMGGFAREGIIFSASGWSNPLYTVSFLQTGAVTYYMVETFINMPYKLSVTPKK